MATGPRSPKPLADVPTSRAIVNLAVGAVVFYGALVGGVYLIQRSLMYAPGTDTPVPEASGVPEMRPVRVTTSDGVTLTSWYRPAAQGMPTVVFFHGNAGHIGHRGFKARTFLDAGYGLVLVGYRGYGGNPGSPTEEGFYADGRAVLELLARNGVAASRMVLYGESLGTGVAVHLALEAARAGVPVGAVVLEAPFDSMAEMARYHYPYLPAYWLVKDRYESVAKIDRIGSPLFLLHGGRDQVVPSIFGRKLFQAARDPKELLVLPEADHNDLFEHGAGEKVVLFLRKVLVL